MYNKIHKRVLINKIKKWLKRSEMIVITGARQTGKTFLVREILPTVTDLKIRYFNFEDFELRELYNQDPKEFIYNISDKEYIYIFDEFQKVPGLTSLLKVKYDLNKKDFPKIILTGSSHIGIQQKITQSLTGQCIIFNLFSLSFQEKFDLPKKDFLDNIGQLNVNKLKKETFFRQQDIKRKFDQYLLQGGYPELGELDQELRWDKLQSIIQTVLEKDLQNLVKAEHLFSAKKLLEILAYRVGSNVSFENLASEMQLNVKTVRNLIATLEGLFFIELIYPLSSYGNEYKKSPKIYFYDNGIRNELIKIRQLPGDNTLMGPLVENFIFSQLKRYASYSNDYKFNYWQDYNKNEVDFILGQNNTLISIEVKYRKSQKQRVTAGIVNFIKRYQPQCHITITYDYWGSSELDHCKLYFIPAYVFGLLI